MKKEPEFSPGTVSKILWHFTGGPQWNDQTKRQAEKPKPAEKAFKALCSIMESHELRLGAYTEIVRTTAAEETKSSLETGRIQTRRTVYEEIASAPVCCLADIPVVHLGYHRHRYGKFAIGFRRSAAIHNGFNPVFYSPEYAEAVRSICYPLYALKVVNPGHITRIAREIDVAVRPFANQIERIDILRELATIEDKAETIAIFVDDAFKSLLQFVAYVKTFQEDEFGTVYCEREWRSLKDFTFSYDDLAMIVLPRCDGKRQYFEEFVTKVVPRIKLAAVDPYRPLGRLGRTPETNSEYVLVPADLYDQIRELIYEHSTLTQDEKRAVMVQAGLRAGWDDPEMDVYNDLDPRRQQ